MLKRARDFDQDASTGTPARREVECPFRFRLENFMQCMEFGQEYSFILRVYPFSFLFPKASRKREADIPPVSHSRAHVAAYPAVASFIPLALGCVTWTVEICI